MARTLWIVLLLVLAISLVIAQTGSVSAVARGGFQYFGNDGEAAGSISGRIRLGTNSSADMMFILKDPGGISADGSGEAVIFLKTVEKSKVTGNKMVVTGMGFFQGEQGDVEITLIDSINPKVKDQIRVRFLRAGHALFDHSAKLDRQAITITRQN